jgi:hypothetical protein
MNATRIILVTLLFLLIGGVAPSIQPLHSQPAVHPLLQPAFLIWFHGSNIIVKNIGDANATNVHVRRSLASGLIIIGKDRTVTIPQIAVGEEKEATMGWIFGFGRTVITMSVWCDEGIHLTSSRPAKVYFFLIRLI